MPRRHRPDASPAELEAAFAANIAWLRRHGRRLPRHLCQIGHHLAPCSFRDAQAEIGRWIAAGDMIEDARGDYRLTKAGEARLRSACAISCAVETPGPRRTAQKSRETHGTRMAHAEAASP